MIQRDAVSDLASNVWMRMSYLGLKVVIPPEIIAQLIIQLLTMLFAAKCYPTPEAATQYVNSQRYFRTMRISRMTRRVLRGLAPNCPPETEDVIVRAVQMQCRICTVYQMNEYYRTIQSLKAEGKAPPVQP